MTDEQLRQIVRSVEMAMFLTKRRKKENSRRWTRVAIKHDDGRIEAFREAIEIIKEVMGNEVENKQLG